MFAGGHTVFGQSVSTPKIFFMLTVSPHIFAQWRSNERALEEFSQSALQEAQCGAEIKERRVRREEKKDGRKETYKQTIAFWENNTQINRIYKFLVFIPRHDPSIFWTVKHRRQFCFYNTTLLWENVISKFYTYILFHNTLQIHSNTWMFNS